LSDYAGLLPGLGCLGSGCQQIDFSHATRSDGGLVDVTCEVIVPLIVED
jgi:hypothetical protein